MPKPLAEQIHVPDPVLRTFSFLLDCILVGELATFLLLEDIRSAQAKLEDAIFDHKREVLWFSDALTIVGVNIVAAKIAIVNTAPAELIRLIKFLCITFSCLTSAERFRSNRCQDYYYRFSRRD